MAYSYTNQITTNEPVIGQAYVMSVPIIDLSTSNVMTTGINLGLSTAYISLDGATETIGGSLSEIAAISGHSGIILCNLTAANMSASLVNVRIVCTSNSGGIHTCLTSNTSLRPQLLQEIPTKWLNQNFIRSEQALVQDSAFILNSAIFNAPQVQVYDNLGNPLLAYTFQDAPFSSTRSSV